MHDPTESFRRELVHTINTQTESNDEDNERARLLGQHEEVWDTKEVSQVFQIEGFMAPYVVATHKESGERGTLMFQHSPRFYFRWTPDTH